MSYVTILCPLCDSFSTKQGKKFVTHLRDEHSITDVLALYLILYHNGVHPTCECSPECQHKLTWYGWKAGFHTKFARGHNAVIDSCLKDRAKEFAQKRHEGYASGKYAVWNRGLTKETSEKVDSMSQKAGETLARRYASGELVDWRANDAEKASQVARAISQKAQQRVKDGTFHQWCKGLTKDTDPRLANISKLTAERMKDGGPRRLKDDEILRRIANDNFTLVSDIGNYRNVYHRFAFRCNRCGTIQMKSIIMMETSPVCFTCFPKTSAPQHEIYEYVHKTLGFTDAVLSDREAIRPKELDVFVPSKRVGIEHDGLWWHTTRFLKEGYAAEKLRACEAAGVRLMNVFEDEWRDKEEQVMSHITQALDACYDTIDADDCNVIEMSPAEASEFFCDNDVLPLAVADRHYGLESQGETVFAVSCLGDTVVQSSHALFRDVVRPFAKLLSKIDVAKLKTDTRLKDTRELEQISKSYTCDATARVWYTDCINRFVTLDEMPHKIVARPETTFVF